MELEQIAAAAAAHGDVTGVLAAEAASGRRSFLVAFGEGDAREWLVLDAEARPVDERVRVLEVASLVAMCELAAELAGLGDEPRVASPAYLDAVGTAELGASTAVVDAFVNEVEQRYKLPLANLGFMEGGFPFGGDPEDLLRGLREFAEQQAETVQEAQREQFATLTLSTAVELTSAALSQVQTTGTIDEQAVALRDAMRVLFPEAVALVSAARQGFMRETS